MQFETVVILEDVWGFQSKIVTKKHVSGKTTLIQLSYMFLTYVLIVIKIIINYL